MTTIARALATVTASVVVLAGAAVPAHAHLVNTRLGDFYGGMLHPLTGLEDVLPWLALAILAGLQGSKHARWLVAVFPPCLGAAALASLVGPAMPLLPGLGIGLAAVVGMAAAAAAALPVAAVIVFGAAMALVSGYQNGQAMTGAADPLLFVAGVTAIGYLFITLATGLVIAFVEGHGAWRQIALRASGSWVAAVGIMALGLQLFRPPT
jgi:urease accessory protein